MKSFCAVIFLIVFCTVWVFKVEGDVSVNTSSKVVIIEDSKNASLSSNQSAKSAASKEPVSGATIEKQNSFAIFFILCVLFFSILLVYLLIKFHFHYLPESIGIVFLGAIIGALFQVLNYFELADFKEEEMMSPTIFFLIMLPPIIFESGYSLHKGNFFANFGSIFTYAVLGTAVSALTIGSGLFVLGIADVVYPFTLKESLSFGALISAVDPVATLAIFQSIDVHPTLYMLVFGESVLNDAVSIVMCDSVINFDDSTSTAWAITLGVGSFLLKFTVSSLVGVIFALALAIILKYVHLNKVPSLEFCTVGLFAYGPYFLADGLNYSGIMAILASGIVMSHYAHFNLSPVTQITVQQTFRTFAFLAESMVFAYLGMAIFSFSHSFKPAFVIWTLILCLVGRAINIFPISVIVNKFREHQIDFKKQFVMWFSGLRGAIAFSLALHLPFPNEKRRVIVSTTLVIVLFSILFFGGSTMPLMKLLQNIDSDDKSTTKHKKLPQSDNESDEDIEDSEADEEYPLSKTMEMGRSMEANQIPGETDSDIWHGAKGFTVLDNKYFIPLFRKRFTKQEIKDAYTKMQDLTNQWHSDVEGGKLSDERDCDESSL
ncbi:hypothetical protein ACHWQZ_G007842 [Mnemiopsis leidyi]